MLIAKYGDAGLPQLLSLLSADCEKRIANKITDRCGARYEWPDGPPLPREDR
jgi:hypothetical protein